MKHKIWFALLSLVFVVGCKSSPHKAEKIDTKLESEDKVSGTARVGIDKSGDMVVMDKVAMSEQLRDLQNVVYGLEDKVYGTRKLNTQGLYGELKACTRKAASKQHGGSGQMVWSEPLDRVTDKEEEFKVGMDEKKQLVGVTNEYLKDRISRFQGYKLILQKRHDEYESRLDDCKTQLKDKQSNKTSDDDVRVSEVSKARVNRAEVNEYMCGYVKSGASLQALLLNAFAKGWLSLSDFGMNQAITVSGMQDVKGKAYDNGFMFSGWKLVYDAGPMTIGNVLSDGKDAKLIAWTYSPKSEIKNASLCLRSDDRVWNR